MGLFASRQTRGRFALGLIVGLLIGLTLALGVALYVTKAPVPFVDRVPVRTGENEAEEKARNKDWNPNAGLASKVPRPPQAPAERDVNATPPAGADAGGAPAASTGVAPPGPPTARDPAAILSGAPAAATTSSAKPVPPATAAGGPPAVTPSGPQPAAAAPAGKATAAATASSPAPNDGFVYFVQAGAFIQIDEAQSQRAKLAMLGLEAKVFAREQAGRTVHRVRVGPFETAADAETARERLARAGIEATLVRMDKSAASNQ